MSKIGRQVWCHGLAAGVGGAPCRARTVAAAVFKEQSLRRPMSRLPGTRADTPVYARRTHEHACTANTRADKHSTCAQNVPRTVAAKSIS